METKKDLKFHAKFKESNGTIEELQARLLQDILTLKFSEKELYLSREFIKDKVNIFRFLKEKRFDVDSAHADLLSTIEWRRETKLDQLDYKSCSEFFEDGFAFFHGTDNLEDHPLLFVRLRYFPRQPGKSLSEQLLPFSCYLHEIARKYTWDMTRNRMAEGHPYPLVWKVKVIANVANAPLLPVDGQLIKTLGPVLGQRFPGFISSVHVLNFGWMYQGIWSVLKYLLSEKAKSFINFTSVKELESSVTQDRILKEMGGTNDFTWSMENDKILQRYGKEPMLEEDLSFTRSSSVSDDSSDEFFDAQDVFLHHHQQQQEPLVPRTFKLISAPKATVTMAVTKRNSHLLAICKRFLYNSFQLAFGPKKGLVYWVLLYVILRGPAEKWIKQILTKSALVNPKRLNATAIGLTAVAAALVSSGLEKYRK